jgi:hypothetical protein
LKHIVINVFYIQTIFVSSLGFVSKILHHGEAGSIDFEKAKAPMEIIHATIVKYKPENVYNMDESGLFFKVLPNKSYVLKTEKRCVRGTRAMKETKARISIFVCTNATCCDKFPIRSQGAFTCLSLL